MDTKSTPTTGDELAADLLEFYIRPAVEAAKARFEAGANTFDQALADLSVEGR